jgi:hypothetical protein
VFACDALTPRRQFFRLDLGQENSPARGDTEAGLKWVRERHINLAQRYCLNLHCVPFYHR